MRGDRRAGRKAEPLFHQRIDYDDGAIVEMVLWRIPSPVPPSTHDLIYPLFYGRAGVREIGYDNERGAIIGISGASKHPIPSSVSNSW
ncbi:MAG: hypothetical protein ACREFA_01865 [Stellaceae bacterium]